ncbi:MULTISPECIES: hypothetical protein [Methylobacterium]|jgi:hypothetical protein|uniref:Uncharacterized protein n=1 Tax=Methylobacterium longum TaxID=767694 RepID=A0ABT8ALP5_9HYPH|nr:MULTISPECIES: hypothetical protein [Methylobacterium]MCJ2102841.1 hypothetical protein [Methylobacterium sp. E-046]MDN3570208.1 hypothetical protein [Methylobacterium longum]GJE13423.1 hypothetical protein FOHLNKBM_4486 [Methylobacterium longum]
MPDDEEDGAAPSWKEVGEGEATSRKKLIEGGGPHQPPPAGEPLGKDRPTGTVSEDEETGPVDRPKGT